MPANEEDLPLYLVVLGVYSVRLESTRSYRTAPATTLAKRIT